MTDGVGRRARDADGPVTVVAAGKHHVGAGNHHRLARPEAALQTFGRELVAPQFDRMIARGHVVVREVAVRADGADARLIEQHFRARGRRRESEAWSPAAAPSA